MVQVEPPDRKSASEQLRREKTQYDRIQDHRHVIKVHDIHLVSYGGATLLVLSMEYADGGSYRQWLRAHKDDWQTRRTQGLGYFSQMCRGVASVHAAGVVHLDLKPENAMFVGDVLKVADFGISTCVHNLGLSQTSVLPSQVTAGAFGTAEYASPTRIAGHGADARDDIYSLGVMAYETLEQRCRRPFEGSPERLCHLHQHAPPPPLVDVGELEAKVVGRCLEKDPAKRYQRVEDLLDDLEGRSIPAAVEADSQPEIDDRASSMLQRAECCANEEQLSEAIRLCRKVLQVSPDRQEAGELLEQLQSRYDQAQQLYTAVEQELDRRDLEELTVLFEQAAQICSDHPAGQIIRIKLAARAKQYRQAMEEGVAAVQRGEWESAQAWFERAGQQNPGSGHVHKAVRFVQTVCQREQEAKGRIDAAIAAQDFDLAMGLAREIDQDLEAIKQAVRRTEPEAWT